jgi:hypothetical protein
LVRNPLAPKGFRRRVGICFVGAPRSVPDLWSQENPRRTTIPLIPKGKHSVVPFKNGMDNAPLHANSTAVNNAHFAISLQNRLVQVFLNQVRNFTRLKRMEIDGILNWQLHRFRHFSSLSDFEEIALILHLKPVHF